ncbi:unnamed protein product [Diatraea saccharalis]|uniref:TIL domain-containing protein n=1 Tax=Diatraea saccharalis TaxID=40085 RepID=A0A9N9R450_9NEOP|nr:unnamed protein product [Diatraea saccharalis]
MNLTADAAEVIFKLETTEPRPNGTNCPENEEYRFCETCNRTCDNAKSPCPAQCARGCFCMANKQYTDVPIPYKMMCNANQVYKDCENCEKTCSNPNPHCSTQCSRGCFCKEGLYKAPDGECLELDKCPKAEESIGTAHEPSIEDCDIDEEYYACGWCEPTCSEPEPRCPLRVCTRGCQCRPPLLRHRTGKCVTPELCSPQKCEDPNEEYACRYGCEASCIQHRCVRPRRCELGCHCKLGLLRDHFTGKCVEKNQCTNGRHTITDLKTTILLPNAVD